MKVICLIPSISETLLACGVQLVGRSRFCIHPEEQVKPIPAVGGTKDINWSKTASLDADLVILDKEENTLAMAETCPYAYIALHITSIADVATELERLAECLKNQPLMQIAHRWRQIAQNPLPAAALRDLSGVIEWWRPVTQQHRLLYLIWQDPYMSIGNNTFIQSVLDHCGLADYRVPFNEKYPTLSLDDFPPSETVLLFSSEPFPFERYRESLLTLGYACALVDGEKFSWYGIRSLEFLESLGTR